MTSYKKLVADYMNAKNQDELNYAFANIEQQLWDDLCGDAEEPSCDLKSGVKEIIQNYGGHIRNLENEDYINNRQNYV